MPGSSPPSDETRRNPAEAAAATPWEHVKHAFDQSTDCVFVKSPDGKMLYANQAFVQTFSAGATPAGMSGDEFLPEELRDTSRFTDDLVLSSKNTVVFSYECAVGQGGRQRFNTMKFPMIGAGNEVVAIFGISYVCSDGTAELDRWRALDIEVLRDAADKLSGLTDKQRVAIHLVCQGQLNKQVASQLDVSVRSIEAYRSQAMKLLGVKSSAELVQIVTALEQSGLYRVDEHGAPADDQAEA